MKTSYLISVSFLLIIFGIGLVNLGDVIPSVVENVAQDETYFVEGGKRLEEDYRVGFYKRRDWVDLYGIVQKGLNRKIIGNMEFMKTEEGLLSHITKEVDVYPFSEEMVQLKNRLDGQGIPLLYVQMPPRIAVNSSDPDKLDRTRVYYEKIRKITDEAGVMCLDETEIFQGQGALPIKQFYFKTDVHNTTEGEAWAAHKIAEILNQKFGVSLSEVDVDDGAKFSKHSHPFLGNLAQSVGSYYMGVDEFTEYIPNEQPNYCVSELSGGWEQKGNFEQVIMNGYDNNYKEEKYTYWITNYLKYGASGYNIENLDSKGPNLLFICDSMCYRTIAYLSLQSNNITLLDPKFYPNTQENMVEKALSQRDYDAVVYLHGTFGTTEASMFKKEDNGD